MEYRFGSDPGKTMTVEVQRGVDGRVTFEIPVSQPKPPGITARLRVETQFWNRE